MTKVSTITPSYKSEQYLKGFLKSVKQQTHKNLEIILDHKVPTENEINIVKKFNSKNNNIKHSVVDRVDPIGVSMNRCIENSTGEYLCIWNVDDLRTPKSIEVMAKVLDEREDVDIVIGKYIMVNKFKRKKGNIVDESKRSHSEFLKGMLLGPFFMFRKSLLSKTGKFDDFLKKGIIDPTKVTRCALENAASIASTILLTECTVVNKPQENQDEVGAMPGMF